MCSRLSRPDSLSDQIIGPPGASAIVPARRQTDRLWPADASSANRQKGRGYRANRSWSPVASLTPFSPHTSKTASDILYGPLLLIAPVNRLLQRSNLPAGMRAERAPFNSNIGMCLLLALSGHDWRCNECPLYPQKRTSELSRGMSALSQKRTCQLLRLYVDLLLNNNR